MRTFSEIIVGDIEDEYDAPREEDVQKINDDEYIFHGRTYLKILMKLVLLLNLKNKSRYHRRLHLSLQAGHVPLVNERFEIAGWEFIVTEADTKQIHKISAQRLSQTVLTV